MKAAYLYHDNREDRKELWYLLEQLTPRQRLAFLRWCCKQCHLPGYEELRPRVAKRTVGLVGEVYNDLWLLSVSHGLGMTKALTRLTNLVRKARP